MWPFSPQLPTNTFLFYVLISARPSWFLLPLEGWSLSWDYSKENMSLCPSWSSTTSPRTKRMETHEKQLPDVPLGPFLHFLYLGSGEFPAAKTVVEGFSFSLSNICDFEMGRNRMHFLISLAVMSRGVWVVYHCSNWRQSSPSLSSHQNCTQPWTGYLFWSTTQWKRRHKWMIIATQPYWKQVMKFSLQLREACRSLFQMGIKQLHYCTYLGLAWEGKVLLQKTRFPAASWLPENSWPSLSTGPTFWLIVKVLTGNPSSIPKPRVASFTENSGIPLGYHKLQNCLVNLDPNVLLLFWSRLFGILEFGDLVWDTLSLIL